MAEPTKIPQTILRQYEIGTIKTIRLISGGLIHQTFEIKSDRGQYIMQRLHPVLATPEIAHDIFAVTTHLTAKGLPVPTIILTKKRTVLAQSGNTVWRLQTKLPGRTYHAIESLRQAKEAGRLLGAVHVGLQDLAEPLQTTRHAHQTRDIYKQLCEVQDRFASSELMFEVRDEMTFLIKQLPKYFLPVSLPQRVIHGDPKISNFLFVGDHAAAMVDWDTVNRQTLLVELGDALRSWCGKQEDDAKNQFSLSYARAVWNGYEESSSGLLKKKERNLLDRAIGTILLELSARFVIDYFEDHYFGWNADHYPSRRMHNLARLRGQLAEFDDYERKRSSLLKLFTQTKKKTSPR